MGRVTWRGDVGGLGPVRTGCGPGERIEERGERIESQLRVGVGDTGGRPRRGEPWRGSSCWRCCEHTTGGSSDEGRGAPGHATIDNVVARARLALF